MNTNKIYLRLLALILVASAAFAFNTIKAKPEKASETTGLQWFSYDGGGIGSPSNYTELEEMPDCSGNVNLCAILAPEDGNSGRPTQAGVNSPTQTKKFD